MAFTWLALIGFVRLSMNPRSFQNPWDVGKAPDVVDGLLAQPAGTIVHPTDRHAAVLRDPLTPPGAAQPDKRCPARGAGDRARRDALVSAGWAPREPASRAQPTLYCLHQFDFVSEFHFQILLLYRF